MTHQPTSCKSPMALSEPWLWKLALLMIRQVRLCSSLKIKCEALDRIAQMTAVGTLQ